MPKHPGKPKAKKPTPIKKKPASKTTRKTVVRKRK